MTVFDCICGFGSYIGDNCFEWCRERPAVVSTIAGGNGIFGGYTDGVGTNARFKFPTGLAIDACGNMFVADQANHRIRKVTASGGTRIGSVDSARLLCGHIRCSVGVNSWALMRGHRPSSSPSVYVSERFLILSVVSVSVCSTHARAISSCSSVEYDGRGDFDGDAYLVVGRRWVGNMVMEAEVLNGD